LLSSPFIKHACEKPYGYAGDFEMVLKILDKEIEGETPLAKLLNMFIWNMDVTRAHRNRIDYLVDKISNAVAQKSRMKILSLGSGPAREIKYFIERGLSINPCSFTLVDFDARALSYSQEALLSAISLNNLDIVCEFINKSVRQIVKTKSCDLKFEKYDLIYCAGLFDYLSDSFCERLLDIMYSQLNPGGMIIASNVTNSNYYRYVMEFMGEWYLTHRSGNDMLMLAKKLEKKGDTSLAVDLDATGANVLLNVEKSKSLNPAFQQY